jgi:hypothetical protein
MTAPLHAAVYRGRTSNCVIAFIDAGATNINDETKVSLF